MIKTNPMKKLIGSLLLTMVLFIPVIAQEDAEGSKDPSLFTRMPGFHIYRYDDRQFDKYEFQVNSVKTQPVEGHYLSIIYYLNENVESPSPLQVVRNYTNAIKKIGGQLVNEFEDGGYQNVILKLVKNGQEVWAHVSAAGNGIYTVNLIEKKAMDQDVVADATSMAGSIKETGRVAVYGIYFDVGKAILKDESEPTLQEIAKLLNADPSLKLFVVGHTDNTGLFDANMKLSMDRAVAVVNALVSSHSVNASSLKACAAGPIAPVASNGTEEGRALNRRVELVKQ
jgi:outer membrane protein OmpA-like peptidoglycan-associated protein